MSDPIKHECGLTVVRLLKPLEFYTEKYGTPFYGLNKLHLLMQKMRNRGQDGAGIASIKLNPAPGHRYISRKRSNRPNPLRHLFDEVFAPFQGLSAAELRDTATLKADYPYLGELMMGHLRYGTHGRNSIEACHPFLRQNNWISRNLVLAGNFNLTNVDELFAQLVELGQYPKEKSDTVTVLEKIGHFLDDEITRLHGYYRDENTNHAALNQKIFEQVDIQRVLTRAAKKWDGGYTMGGLIGHGDAFVMRDPNGIRPAYYYEDDEVVAMASERPALQTTFQVHRSKIQELTPGHALIIRANGEISEKPFIEPGERMGCSFERVYFSRGTDWAIYQERKQLGRQLTDLTLRSIGHDLKHAVFCYVPNTAETAFYGLVEGLNERLNEVKMERILSDKKLKREKLEKVMGQTLRVEKLVVKDEKLRTFIADDASRGEMVSHVYDTTYGVVRDRKDTVVVLDDSIVRGTTLRESIIKAVARLSPKKIVVLSSAPQIRYPDCYGIDMSKMGEFIAFQALISLLQETGQEKLINRVYKKAKDSLALKREDSKINYVQELYAQFDYEQISARISDIVTPDDIDVPVEVIFQTVEGLREATGPDNDGDWYFTGDYPTPGGVRVVNQAFVNYVERRNIRAYA